MIARFCIPWMLALVLSASACLAQDAAAKKRILMFSPSFGFRHSVVQRPETGEMAHAEKQLKEFAGKAGYDVRFSQDFNDLTSDGQFKDIDALVIYTTGNPPISRDAFVKWVRNGGAIVGIHTATDSFHSESSGAWGKLNPWPEYVEIIGAAFKTHGRTHDPVTIKVEDPNSPATKMLPQDWKIGDEIYQFRSFSRDRVHVLLSIDTEKMDDKTLEGHRMKRGEDYPVSWTRTEGKGRVFYTSLGHREDVWTNPLWQQHLLGGLAWALRAEGETK